MTTWAEAEEDDRWDSYLDEQEGSRGRHPGPSLLPGIRPGDGANDDVAALAGIAAAYTPVNWAEAWLDQPEETDWLFDGWLETGTVNALFAKPGTGKSLLTLEVAVSIVRDGKTVVYVDDENRVKDLVDRLQSFGCAPEELARLVLYSFASLPPLDSQEGGIHLLALAVTSGAALVILDTTTRMIAGRENDSDTFLQLYRCSLVPLKARGITVLRLDHPGKDAERGQRGSSAKDGDVDTIWLLSEVVKGADYRLERTKSRSGHGPDVFGLLRHADPLRHEWEQTTCPQTDLRTKIIGQLDDLNVPIEAGRDSVRKILGDRGIKASNAEVSAAIKVRKRCPGQVTDSADSGNSLAVLSPTPHIGGGQADRYPAGTCADCGEPHQRYGSGGRPCRDAAQAMNGASLWPAPYSPSAS